MSTSSLSRWSPLFWVIHKLTLTRAVIRNPYVPSLHPAPRQPQQRGDAAHIPMKLLRAFESSLTFCSSYVQLLSSAMFSELLEAVWVDLCTTPRKLSAALAIPTAATTAINCKKYTTSPRGKRYQEITGPHKHLMWQPVYSLWQFQERCSYNDVHTWAQYLLRTA